MSPAAFWRVRFSSSPLRPVMVECSRDGSRAISLVCSRGNSRGLFRRSGGPACDSSGTVGLTLILGRPGGFFGVPSLWYPYGAGLTVSAEKFSASASMILDIGDSLEEHSEGLS